jgi:hypothetical protein
MVSHLDQVLAADRSAEVPQEDEQRGPAGAELRQLHLALVGAEQHGIRGATADSKVHVASLPDSGFSRQSP